MTYNNLQLAELEYYRREVAQQTAAPADPDDDDDVDEPTPLVVQADLSEE